MESISCIFCGVDDSSEAFGSMLPAARKMKTEIRVKTLTHGLHSRLCIHILFLNASLPC
jgi:hypothetical protein